jgi:hypothetical protein
MTGVRGLRGLKPLDEKRSVYVGAEVRPPKTLLFSSLLVVSMDKTLLGRLNPGNAVFGGAGITGV